MTPYGAELRFRGADDGNRTRVFSLGSRFKASRGVSAGLSMPTDLG
jgi:hypothetical protein